MIITGIVWLVGFLGTQFLSSQSAAYLWIAASVLGTSLASILGSRRSRRLHSPSAGTTARRIGLVWLLLAICCVAAIAIAWPLDGKQLTCFIILFMLIGWLVTGLWLSFMPVWPWLILIALTLAGYFLLPGIFYLWIGVLGGGGLIALGLYIRMRW